MSEARPLDQVDAIRAEILRGLLDAEYRMSVLYAFLGARGFPKLASHRAVTELIASGHVIWTPSGTARLSPRGRDEATKWGF